MQKKNVKTRNRYKKCKIVFIFMLFSIISFIIVKSTILINPSNETIINSKYSYENAINTSNYIINNEYFSINSKGYEPDKTTKGINDAIKYANNNNITYIKLEKGIYKINYNGIELKSNITLDLNGSQIIQSETDRESYSNFTFRNLKNVTLYNGIIVGDRQEHNFSNNSNSTHEWGHGIKIFGGDNIKIINLEIYDMIGDGIYICSEDNKNPTNIKIKNLIISNCRRQGISIIAGENIKIDGCEINNISGTNPQSGIDLESNQGEQVINNICITNNMFYNYGENNAIMSIGNVYNCIIKENFINGNILINDAKEKLEIIDNRIQKGDVKLLSSYANINIGHTINNVFIERNNINNGNILAQKVENAVILNNEIYSGNVNMISSSGRVEQNILRNSNTDEIIENAFIFSKLSGHTESYFSTFKQNQIIGNIKNLIIVDESCYTIER